MAGKSGYSVTITATDRASAVIDQINRRLAATNAPVDRLGKSFNRLAANTGLRGFRQEIKGLADSSARLMANMGRIMPGAALLGGGGVASLAIAARQANSFGQNLRLNARAAGASVGAVQRLGYAAQMSGGSASGAADAFAELNRNLQLYQHGSVQTSGPFKYALASLGLSLKNAGGGWKSSSQVMSEILHKLAGMHNAQEQLYYGNALLGGSFRSVLWPAVAGGQKVLDSYLRASAHMVRLNKHQATQLALAQVQTMRLSGDLGGLANLIMSDLAPAEVRAAGGMARWIEANKGWLAQDLGTGIKVAGEALALYFGARVAGRAVTTVTALGRGLFQVGSALGEVAGGFGTAKSALSAFAAVAEDLAGPMGALGAIAGLAALWGRVNPVSTPGQKARAAYAQRYLAEPGRVRAGLAFGGASGVGGSGVPGLPTAAARKAAMAQAATYFRKHGYTPAWTAGLLTNASAESGFNPAAVGDHGTSFGLFQWHGPRARMLVQYARQHGWRGTDPRTIPEALQLGFANWELTQGDQKAAGRMLRRTTSAPAASYAVTTGFERPAGGASTAQLRANYAADFMPAAAAPITHTVKGAATVHVQLSGAPAGTRVSANTSGDLFTGAPRVVMPMPAGGGP